MQQISSRDISDFEKRYRTNLINSLSGFKSVALLGTINNQGRTNLAIFSQIVHIGANPPLVGVIFRPHTVPRHTLENIALNGSFTVNLLTEEIVEAAHHTSARWPGSEFDACQFTPHFEDHIPAPFIQEAVVKFACEFRERQDIQINGTILLIGEIVRIILPGEIIQADGYVDLEQAGTLTSLGLDSYHSTRRVVRYSYAKPDQPLQKR
jgi:flavin reductase (DIM6/NTAB) family NADH-FMN oxidoreductase RutF